MRVVLLALLTGALACRGLAGRGASVTPERYASVRFGMTLAEARAAYGVPLLPLAPILDPELGCYFVSAHGLADAGEHAIVFETDGTRVTRYRAGRKPEVTWVEGCS